MRRDKFGFMVEVLRIICEHQDPVTTPITPKKIAEKLGTKENQVYVALWRLMKKGLVKRVSRGKYVAVEGVCDAHKFLEALVTDK